MLDLEGRLVPRSSYIYVVLGEEDMVLSAFTVKHELVSWLRREKIQPGDVAIYRAADGINWDGTPVVEVTHLLMLDALPPA